MQIDPLGDAIYQNVEVGSYEVPQVSEIVDLAYQAAGKRHNFKFLQIPFNTHLCQPLIVQE